MSAQNFFFTSLRHQCIKLDVLEVGRHLNVKFGGTRMKPTTSKEGIELEIQIEELEAKVAPDGGETVLPLPGGHGKH